MRVTLSLSVVQELFINGRKKQECLVRVIFDSHLFEIKNILFLFVNIVLKFEIIINM